MGMLFIAILSVIAILIFHLQFTNLSVLVVSDAPIDPLLIRDAVLVLVLFYFGYIALRWRRTQLSTNSKKGLEDNSAARQELQALKQEYYEAKTELLELKGVGRKLEEDCDILRVALTERDQQLAKLRGEGVTERPEYIEAELVNLLSQFQAKGRLVDFLMSEITQYQDAQIGAAARAVHQGCAAVLRQYFEITEVVDALEGQVVEVENGFDVRSYRLVGRVVGEGPYRGKLLHKGWRVGKISLPRVVRHSPSQDSNKVITPAEIEV